MPKMKMDRPFTMRSLSGHTIRFCEENKFTTFVVPELANAAKKYGAVVVEEDKPAVKKTHASANSDREAKLIESIESIIARNDREDFTAGGKPTKKAVIALSGVKDADIKEIAEIYNRVKSAEADASEVVVGVESPDTPTDDVVVG